MLIVNSGQRLFVRLACMPRSKAMVFGIAINQSLDVHYTYSLMSGVAVLQVTIRPGTP